MPIPGFISKTTAMKNNFFCTLLVILLITGFSVSCNTGLDDDLASAENNAEINESADDYVWDKSTETKIVLQGSAATITGSGASASGSMVTIKSAGNYNFSGNLTDGQILVNTSDQGIVRVILSGVTISNSSGIPLYVASAEKTILVLSANTVNSLSDGKYTTTDEPNAAVFSKSDLAIFGDGSLTVNGNSYDGISGKDGLIIRSGTIVVNAADDGIRGKDYLVVRDGSITVTSKGDGLKSDNSDDETCGYFTCEGGTLKIASGGDAIAAETDVLISKGIFTITSGGGSGVSANSTVSSKGIKSGVSMTINEGTFTCNCSDDALHSNGKLTINKGTFTLSTGDDGIHADSDLELSGGNITVTKSYEGIESRTILKINDGNISVTSSDDGINVGADTGFGGPGGMGGSTTTTKNYLYVNGGSVYLNANGDGIDINGSVVMAGGSLIINGPTSSGNGALDYNNSFKMTGGFLVAAGSSGMAQAPDATSTQRSVLINFKSSQKAATFVRIQTTTGTNVLTFQPVKNFQSIAFSSPDLSNGTGYEIFTGGAFSGTGVNGIYQEGTYSGGAKYGSFTVSGIVTKVN